MLSYIVERGFVCWLVLNVDKGYRIQSGIVHIVDI